MSQHVTDIYNIMKKTSKFPGDRLRGEFGVEIETETLKAYDYPELKYWRCEKDGSLRDWGVEYVLKSPMDMPEFERALAEFESCEKKFKFKNGSISTSVHVHLNFLNDSYLTLANFLTAYILVENLLIRYSGPDRLSNLFCLPVCDCEGVKDSLVTLLNFVNRNLFGKVQLSPDRVKYGAINAAPLSRLGTVEVRSFRGETDVKVIQKWVEILMKLKNFARRGGMTPPDILKLWKDNREVIVDIIFQEYANELKIKKDGKDITGSLIIENLKHASALASVSRDWKKFGILKVKPIYKEMIKDQLDKISQTKFGVGFDSLMYHDRIYIMEEFQRSNATVKVVDIEEDI